MKATWSHPDVLFPIAERLADLCRGCDYVIGIETGGSPYASSIAKDLKISLILARKEDKEGEILFPKPSPYYFSPPKNQEAREANFAKYFPPSQIFFC